MRTVSLWTAGVISLLLVLGAGGFLKLPAWVDDTGRVALASDYEAMQRVTVMVRTGGGHGSGVLIGDSLVLTAAHVVEGAEAVTVEFHDGTEVEAEVAWVGVGGPTGDIAALRLSGPAPVQPVAASCRALDEGESLVAVGNPSTGRAVSSVLRVASLRPWHESVPTSIVVQGAVVFGMSGGPVFDSNGAVVGIVQALFGMRLGMSASATGFGAVFPLASFCDVLPGMGAAE